MTAKSRFEGFALISVLIALVILLALLVPFLSSVLNEGGFSHQVVEEEGVGHHSTGIRDYLLHRTSQGHPSKEFSIEGGTPDSDDLSEYPNNTLPAAFDGKMKGLHSSSILDLQRKIHLPTASPLVLGNLLGLATSISEDHEPDAETITVLNAENFPLENGHLFVHGERIGYAQREGNTFHGLRRQWDPAPKIVRDVLALDYRVVKAVTYQFERSPKRDEFIPYSSVAEVQNIATQGVGRFTKREMDILLAHCTTHGQNEYAGLWGKPARMFNGQDPSTMRNGYSIRTKTAVGFGGGTIIRIESIEDPSKYEYNFVWRTQRPSSAFGQVNLQSQWQLNVLYAPGGGYEPLEAQVYPLVPVAVNVNTAGFDVLVALMQTLRKGPTRNPDHQADPADNRRQYGREIDAGKAAKYANEIIALRSGATEDGEGRPFQGWQDFVERFFFPKVDTEDVDGIEKQMLVALQLNLLYGRSPAPEMGTMPICFTSGPLVQYRVATMKTRLSGLETARNEVSGVASVMPGHSLDSLLFRQRGWLENIRLTRRSPRWITFPTNIGAIASSSVGSDPAEIAPGLLYAKFFPTAGFGNPRFPSQERGSIRQGPATTPRASWPNGRGRIRNAHEQFRFAQNPDGREVDKEGSFDLINTGPRGQGGAGRRRPRHPDASFAYTTDNEGMPGRHAVSFWFKLKGTGDQCIYDLAAEVAERNRINLRFEAGNLVFEVVDEAGIDPNPQDTQTSPERTAGLWKVPVADINLKPEIWYHVNISADGNRPDQLSLFFDGVPRGKPEYVTYLSAEIPEYERPADGVTPANDKERYPEIKVEDAASFPPQGVIRIGRELFEYTSRTDTSFICRPADSIGERKARMGWREYNKVTEDNLDQYGRPTIGEDDPSYGTQRDEKAPAIPAGAAVELYGYAAAIYRNRPITVGSTTLRDELGAFHVARVMLQNPVTVEVPAPQGRGTFRLGKGFDLKLTDDILLTDPLPDEKGKGVRKPDAVEEVTAAFPQSGGYALLIQKHYRWTVQANDPTVGGSTIDTGGIELIKYSSRRGNKLSGIERAATIPGTEKFFNSGGGGGGRYKHGEARQFVSEWAPYLMQQVGGGGGGGGGGGTTGGTGQSVPLSELQSWVLYVVPISIPVANAGSLNDPAETETTEWCQIYPGQGNEQDTEWVRYDVITPDGQIARARQGPWYSLHGRLTNTVNLNGQGQGSITNGGASVADALQTILEFEPPQDDGIKRIGYIDRVELDWPIAYVARQALQFRGDSFGRTTSHRQGAGAMVMPCHRLEIDWGPLGAMSARCGRNDRVAMVGGKQASGNSRPPLEWHTINWFAQRRNGDNNNNRNNTNRNAAQPEQLGLYPFQMVAFKQGVSGIFVGPDQRQDMIDTRRVDRVVKFPSGEMPAAYVEAGWFGGVSKSVGDYTDMTGVVDEIESVARIADVTLLNIEITAEATEIPIRKHTLLFSYGTMGVSRDVTQTYPKDGGLLQIDQEIIAYKSYGDGIFQVAEGGRGLLGTEARVHADAARVQFLAHVPAAILAGSASAVTNQITVQHLGALPRNGGTVLMGTELLHYTWTVQDRMLEMPNWYDPDDEDQDRSAVGLFRGRYGTPAQTAPSGSPIIWFPTRFWDRYHERSDDPELAYYQATRRETPVVYTGVRWREENPEPSFLKLRATVNIDGAGSWRDDPEKVNGMYTFEKGSVEDKPNKIGWQGSVFEIRFATEYQPGAFDPQQFLSNGWKQAITVKDMIINYEGQTRILEEKQTSR